MEGEIIEKLQSFPANSQETLKIPQINEMRKLKGVLLKCYKALKPGGTVEVSCEIEEDKISSLLAMTGFVDRTKSSDGKWFVGKKVDFGLVSEHISGSVEEGKEGVSQRVKEVLQNDKAKSAARAGVCANCTCGRAK